MNTEKVTNTFFKGKYLNLNFFYNYGSHLPVPVIHRVKAGFGSG